MDISVVIPVYGCAKAIPELYMRLCQTMECITESYEIVLVDDCCPQNSWKEITKICEKDKKVKGIRLSRNFGQMKAILAGLESSNGDMVVVMDCDLQDRPEAIIDLYHKLQEGYDTVFSVRKNRKDNFLTKLLSLCFYRVYNYFTGGVYDNKIGNFSISRRKVIDAYCRMREQNRAFGMFIRWIGFQTATIEIEGDKRFSGTSSYSFSRKIKLALEIIITQSNKPLHFSIGIGFLIAFFSACYIVYLILRVLCIGDTPIGWTTIVASIYLIGGILLCAIGIVGIYIGNIFNETKHRPLYIIQNHLNKGEH